MIGGTRWPKASLLGALGEASRGRLLSQGEVRGYPADLPVIRMSDTTSFVIVLLDGIVKATALSPVGQEVLLAIRVGGDVVGEFAAMDGGPRSATVTTCGPVTGCVIPQPAFRRLLDSDGELARELDKSVLAKLRFANDRRVDFASYDAGARVARVLRELAAAYGERSGNRVLLNWPLTQTELASLASVAEPTVQKALRRLRDSGIVSTGYRSLTIEDFPALDAFIHS
jgi:CRP/FNR family transcriptional regulator, cyclic AMP receptor protein